MFYSKSFTVLTPTFGSSTHFESALHMEAVGAANFGLLHVDFQLFQHHVA